MDEKPYKEGTIKLTWTDKTDYTVLNSTMFNSIEEAMLKKDMFYSGKDFLLMELIKTDGNSYSWSVLPYGDFKNYKAGMHILDNKWKYLIGVGLIGVLIYSFIKK